MNLEEHATADLKLWPWRSMLLMPKQFKSQVTIQEEMNINRRTISEITKIMWYFDNKVRKKENLEQ